MKQSQPTAILVYGTAQANKAKNLTKVPVIDVTALDWYDQLSKVDGFLDDDHFFLCITQAYMSVRKKLPLSTIGKIEKIESIGIQGPESTSPRIAAVRIGDMAVSKKFHESVVDSTVWLSPYHVELIKDLFREGFVIEVLDDFNNLVTVIGDKNVK